MAKKKLPPIDQFAVGNEVTHMVALADLVIDNQITAKDGAKRISKSFDRLHEVVMKGGQIDRDEAAQVIYALATGLKGAVLALGKKGPVMVRYIDGEALVTLLMPDGPPPGMGG